YLPPKEEEEDGTAPRRPSGAAAPAGLRDRPRGLLGGGVEDLRRGTRRGGGLAGAAEAGARVHRGGDGGRRAHREGGGGGRLQARARDREGSRRRLFRDGDRGRVLAGRPLHGGLRRAPSRVRAGPVGVPAGGGPAPPGVPREGRAGRGRLGRGAARLERPRPRRRGRGARVLVLLGGNDGIARFDTDGQRAELAARLPGGGATRVRTIRGGNHSGFASYERASGEGGGGGMNGRRDIALEEQHDEVSRETVGFLLSGKS
ncbi:hypothetical protein THAOC_18610, partial [Thalassiosira oceanica]